MAKLPISLFGLSLLAALPVTAETIEVIGQATIVQGNIDDARRRAHDNAIHQAQYQQGGEFSNEQTIVNGVVSQEQSQWRGRSQIESVEQLYETLDGNQLYLGLRIALAPITQQCKQRPSKVAVSLPVLQVTHRQNMQDGQLYELDQSYTTLISHTLNGESQHSFIAPAAAFSLPMPAQENIQHITRSHNSHYLLSLTLEDLSVDLPHKESLWSRKTPARERALALSAQLFDQSGQPIWQQRYRHRTLWPYAPNAAVNVYSDDFWQSDYGQQLQQVALQLSRDLDNQLQCVPLSGEITAIHGYQVSLNIGRNHGLELGETLQLNQHYGMNAPTLTITELSPWQAQARLSQPQAVHGVQLYDKVSRPTQPLN